MLTLIILLIRWQPASKFVLTLDNLLDNVTLRVHVVK